MAKITIELDDELIARLIAGAQVLHAATGDSYGRMYGAPPAQAEPETAGEAKNCRSADEALPDRDSAGVPWDARIHSDSRARNSDGTWRKRRGVDPALVEAVTKELTAGCGATEQSGVPAVPPPPPWVEALAEAAPLLVERIEAANAEIPPPPVAAAPIRTVSDITLAVATGRVLLADLVALCAEAGVSGVHELAGNPGALGHVVEALEGRGVWSD